MNLKLHAVLFCPVEHTQCSSVAQCTRSPVANQSQGLIEHTCIYMYTDFSMQSGSTGVHDTVVNQLLAKVQ